MATTKRKPTEPEPVAVAELIPAQPPAVAPVPEAGNVVTLYERPPVSPLDLPAEVFRAGLDRRKANRAALMEWVRSALVEGVDFGSIPTKRGPSKPSLWKPGAEKICGMLGVTVAFPTLPEYERAALSGVDLKSIVIRCEIRDAAGNVIADGVGARSLATDYGDLNKALKMAEKSAHIDATLRMAGLSEVFTQDLEDMRPAEAVPPVPETPPVAQRRQTISENDHRRLEATIRDYGLDRERVKAWVAKACKVEHFPDLSSHQFERLLVKLSQWHDEEAQRLAYEMAQADDANTEADPCPF